MVFVYAALPCRSRLVIWIHCFGPRGGESDRHSISPYRLLDRLLGLAGKSLALGGPASIPGSAK